MYFGKQTESVIYEIVKATLDFKDTYTISIKATYVHRVLKPTIVAQHKLRVNLNEDLIEDEKINAIPSFLNEYRFLCQTLDKPGKTIKMVFSVGVLSQSARMLCTIYYYLSEELGIEVRFLLNGFFDVIMSIGITFMPVMLLEMSMHITNDIQRMLSRHLLQYKGPRLREAIYDSLDYIEIHGMKVTLWAHFPMDLSFFFSFVSLVTAYAIAVLQFKY
ncbi:hypothetical protein O3G_MSEX006018 [Manduca sexta]|uniref:Uncharacterized protein n=1 Tax=Manduca sexta TaxID=7130 RepID=A0A922CJM6_MANSE|nr:hypothetical protein O3G_MSEX006018 [Manduca sexta]